MPMIIKKRGGNKYLQKWLRKSSVFLLTEVKHKLWE
jgi:hypothetical protein